MTLSLSARNFVKLYGGVVALSDANLEVYAYEVVALIGANGSGKSTLTKIINGVVVQDDGQLLLDGPVRFRSPKAARQAGIATVFQELSLVPQLTVAENIFLTREPLRAGILVDRRRMRRETEKLLDLFKGVISSSLTPDVQVSKLPPDEKQLVEILKAISHGPRILIFDEATASLDSRQVRRLFQLIEGWKRGGTAIVFVSHRMEEIFQIADRYSVLRNGRTVGQGFIKDVTADDLVALMVGEAAPAQTGLPGRQARTPAPGSQVQLEIKELRTDGLTGLSLQVHKGELLGLGGLRGQGQQSLLRALFGDLPYSGTITLEGVPVRFAHPRQAMEKGLALVPGERAREGLLLIRSILENFQLPSWRSYGFPLRLSKARRDARTMAEQLNLKMNSLDDAVSGLSGGNAQKVVIGKWLLRDPQILLLDDPTKGVDVGAKAEFYKLLKDLCAAGKSVVLYSSDDDELLGLCDRVLVMRDGLIQTELAGDSLTKQNLVAASLGAATHVLV